MLSIEFGWNRFFSSKKLHADFCLQKVNKKTGEVTYYLQMLGAAIVHPDFKEVIPLTPEFINKQVYTLSWTQKKQALKEEAQTDGVFPLLCTDKELTAKEVLKAYKYQPRLEKRFSQFKKFHNAALLLFKKEEHIEANMFGFFIALVIQALIEREVRNEMK